MSAAPLLVLGATSLVGRPLLTLLSEQGWDATALSRVERTDAAGVRWVHGSLETPGGWISEVEGVDACVCLAPVWRLPDALPALVDAGVRRVVAFSSTSVVTKASSADPGERAVAAKLAVGEAEVRRLCEEAGVGWTLLRPTLIYDEGRDGNVSRLAAVARRVGVLPLSGRGEGLRQPVHAADLAAGALAALTSEAAVGRTYALPGGETLSYRTMTTRVFEGLGRRPRIVSVPPVLWRLAFRLAGPWLPGATAAMGARMGADLVFDGAEAARDFGWSPRPFHPIFVAE